MIRKEKEGRGMHAQSCPTLCNSMDCGPPGSSVHEIFQARILEWVAISSSRGSSRPRDQTHISCISCIGRWILYTGATWEARKRIDMNVKLNQFVVHLKLTQHCKSTVH